MPYDRKMNHAARGAVMRTFDEDIRASLRVGEIQRTARATEAANHKAHTAAVAATIQSSDMSDPFAGARAHSHMRNGVAERHDYETRENTEMMELATGELHSHRHRVVTKRP